jgi:hypothetical protein
MLAIAKTICLKGCHDILSDGAPSRFIGLPLTTVGRLLTNSVRATRSTAHTLDPQVLSTDRVASSPLRRRRFEPHSKPDLHNGSNDMVVPVS